MATPTSEDQDGEGGGKTRGHPSQRFLDDWKSESNRQQMVDIIGDALLRCGIPTSKTPEEMEAQIFGKVSTKEEYLRSLKRFVVYIEELSASSMTASLTNSGRTKTVTKPVSESESPKQDEDADEEEEEETEEEDDDDDEDE